MVEEALAGQQKRGALPQRCEPLGVGQERGEDARAWDLVNVGDKEQITRLRDLGVPKLHRVEHALAIGKSLQVDVDELMHRKARLGQATRGVEASTRQRWCQPSNGRMMSFGMVEPNDPRAIGKGS